jgi:hypothetical protein
LDAENLIARLETIVFFEDILNSPGFEKLGGLLLDKIIKLAIFVLKLKKDVLVL